MSTSPNPSLLYKFDNHLKEQLKDKVYVLLRQAEACFNRSFKQPNICFSLRGANAGVAVPIDNLLKFNATMLSEYGKKFIDETAPHELAHLLAYQLYGNKIKPHGIEWQSIMCEVFGCTPSVTHSFAVRMHRSKVYLYKCNCERPVEFSSIRHKRARSGVIYRCRRCKSTLSQVIAKTKNNSPSQQSVDKILTNDSKPTSTVASKKQKQSSQYQQRELPLV